MRASTWIATLTTMALLATPAVRGRTAAAAAAPDSLVARAAVASVPESLLADAPDFMLTDADGMPHRFLGYPGRVHVFVYWSPQCPECKHEMPHLAQLYAREKEHGLAMVSVVGARLGPEAVAYAKEKGIGIPILFDDVGKISRLYHVRMTPTVCVVRGGRVLYRHEGFDPAVPDSVNPAIEALLR